ncbi:hypothetical protein LLH00_05250 [bacterium]|nr:hypothetical protein [bacterium]
MPESDRKDLDREMERLRQRVMLHRQELRREMEELSAVGESLRSEHKRLLREPEALVLVERPPEKVNAMCARCINTCKQDESVKIKHCARFEAI